MNLTQFENVWEIIYKYTNKGPSSSEPWGTPCVKRLSSDIALLTFVIIK